VHGGATPIDYPIDENNTQFNRTILKQQTRVVPRS